MEDIIKRRIINLDIDKINYDDKEEVMRTINDLKNTNKDLSQEKIKLQKEAKRLKNELARQMRKRRNRLNASR